MIIETPSETDAAGHVAEMYAEDRDDVGFVFPYTRAMAVIPAAHQAFEDLLRAVVPSIGIRTYELVTLAAARAIASSHCLLAHGRKALRAGVVDEDQLARLIRDRDFGDLTAADVAAIEYAEKLSTAPDTMTDADTLHLREVGFSDEQIVAITLAAAARNLLSRALLALAVPVVDVPGLSPQLTEALLAPVAELRERRVSGGRTPSAG